MLIGETGETKPPFLRFASNVRPVDVSGDIGISDFFKWRIEKPMARANLNRFANLRSGKSVIDRQNKTTTQLDRDFLDPCIDLLCLLFVRLVESMKTRWSRSKPTSFPCKLIGIASSNSFEK